eukprot:COSAG05_NODE_2296_length_3264_cov_2.037283_3_plen_208_part_00
MVRISNQHSSNGGALEVRGDHHKALVRLELVYFGANKAQRGGAVFAASGVDCPRPYNSTQRFITLMGSTSVMKQMGLGLRYASIHGERTEFSSNAAHGGGGAIFALDAPIVLKSTAFEGNAGAFGGGIHLENTYTHTDERDTELLRIDNGVFDNNRASQGGGAAIRARSNVQCPSPIATLLGDSRSEMEKELQKVKTHSRSCIIWSS